MSRKKLSKEDIKGPDSFVMFSDKVINWIEDRKKPLTWILVLSFLGGAAFVGVSQHQLQQEEDASQSLYMAMDKIEKKQEDFSKDADSLELEVSKDKKKSAEKAKEDPKVKKERELKALLPLLQNLKAQVALYKDTKAGAAAAIEAASAFSEYEKYIEASDVLKTVEPNLKPDELLYGLVHSQIGTLLAESDKCQEAITHFDRVVSNEKHLHLHADTLLRKGLCFEQLNDKAQAKSAYEKVEKDFADTDAARTAKTYLKLLNVGTNKSEG